MTAVASVRPSKIGRVKHPINAPYWNSAITPVLAVFARLGFVLSVGFIGYVLLGVH
jgi:hypothetical protein